MLYNRKWSQYRLSHHTAGTHLPQNTQLMTKLHPQITTSLLCMIKNRYVTRLYIAVRTKLQAEEHKGSRAMRSTQTYAEMQGKQNFNMIDPVVKCSHRSAKR